MSVNIKKPAIFVKKRESKKGELWNELTNDRIIRQHGGFDIPEDDLHAVKKFESPVQIEKASPEETKAALSDLAQEIEGLRQKEFLLPQSQSQNEEVDDDREPNNEEER